MGFQQGLSGLNTSSKALDVISNNIANSGTVGFKAADAQFSDVYSNALSGAAGRQQVGIGAAIDVVRQEFNQGNLANSNNPLDMAINGNGFFMVSSNGSQVYTRNGQFSADKSGNIVNSAGDNLLGYIADPVTGKVNTSSSLTVPLQILKPRLEPTVTTGSKMIFNLDSREEQPRSNEPAKLTGSGAITATAGTPLIVTAGVNDKFITTAETISRVITIPSGTYDSPESYRGAVQTALDSAYTGSSHGATATLDAANNLIIASKGRGVLSSISVTASPGNSAINDMKMAAGTATAGANKFDITDTNSYTSATSQTVYDAQGNPHSFAVFFVKTPVDNRWDVYTALDNKVNASSPREMIFDGNGTLTSTPSVDSRFNLDNGAATPISIKLDLLGTTQFGAKFDITSQEQNGNGLGFLNGLTISAEGTISGRYSNGRSAAIGQVALATFQNPNGLQSLGGNVWTATPDSGEALVGIPGTGTKGQLTAGSVEESNVDLTAELVNMITQQRAYQANAQTIRTQDQILQTLVNLR